MSIHRAKLKPLSSRKQVIIQHADATAPERKRWIDRNAAYYEDDRRTMRFMIPPGAKVLDLGCGTGDLLAALRPSKGVGVDFSEKRIARAAEAHPEFQFFVGDVENLEALAPELSGPFDYIVLSDTIGYLDDVEETLKGLHRLCNGETRIVIAYYSHFWEPVLRLGVMIGQKMPQPEVNFVSPADIANVLHLADFEVIKTEWRQLVPKRLLGVGPFINRYIAPLPLVRGLCLRHYLVARSARKTERQVESVSVLIPCRNEKGNIEPAIQRLPRLCRDIEVLFVEGNSSDGTYEECLRVQEAYSDRLDIKVAKQDGKGKGDAVRKGFDMARGDLLMILDADLTMPPEELPKYYDAYCRGKGEFVNGSRLVYPFEKGAMRFLNYWANRTFAAIFSFLLNQRFTDTLCGTKVLGRDDYRKLAANRSYFGEFDPFGDFDLIFGAAKLNLKIVEVPIRYMDRTYGEPQISRFRDGFLLLKMVVFAWRKLKAL